MSSLTSGKKGGYTTSMGGKSATKAGNGANNAYAVKPIAKAKNTMVSRQKPILTKKPKVSGMSQKNALK